MRKIITDQPERIGAFVAPLVERQVPFRDFAAFGVEEDGVLIGAFIVDSYIKNARASLHVAGICRTWTSRELFFAVFDYVFRQLNCRVLLGFVNARNAPCMMGAQKIGFTEVCRINHAAVTNGEPDDLVVFEMQKSDCRWLHRKKVKNGRRR